MMKKLLWLHKPMGTGEWELYNLREDQNEWYNLAGDGAYEKIKAKLNLRNNSVFEECDVRHVNRLNA